MYRLAQHSSVEKSNGICFKKATQIFGLMLLFLCLFDSSSAQIFQQKIDKQVELNQLLKLGFLDAELAETSDSVWINKGENYTIEQVILHSDNPEISSIFINKASKSDIFSSDALSNLFDYYKKNLEAEGYFKAQILLDSLSINRNTKSVLIYFQIIQAQKPFTTKVEFIGNKRSSEVYLNRVAGLKIPAKLNQADAERAQIRLERSRMFSKVEAPFFSYVDTNLVLHFNVTEQNPNRFDVVLGYIPKTTGGGDIIGSLELDLLNSFTDGNQIALAYNRLQPLRTRLNVLGKQKYVWGSAFSLGLQFDLYQRDSTFQTQNWRLFSDYELSPYSQLTGFVRNETTGSGFTGGNVTNGSALFYGASYEMDVRNDIFVPSKGFLVRFKTEFGLKVNNLDAQTTVFKKRESKQWFSLEAEKYWPIFNRHIIVADGFGSVLLSDFYQDSDLLRFGGSSSFRGYNEEQFAASKVAWINAEYRFLLDRTSYLFTFHSRGWFESPELKSDNGVQFGYKKWIQSYGLGLAYRTRLGLLTFTYAKSPEDSFDNAKIHFSIKGSL